MRAVVDDGPRDVAVQDVPDMPGAAYGFADIGAIVGGSAGGRAAFTATEPSASPTRPASTAHPAGCRCGCCMRRAPLPGALVVGGRVFTAHEPGRRGLP